MCQYLATELCEVDTIMKEVQENKRMTREDTVSLSPIIRIYSLSNNGKRLTMSSCEFSSCLDSRGGKNASRYRRLGGSKEEP